MKTSKAFKQSYWCGKGRLQRIYDRITPFIPASGPCPPELPKTEKLRVAANAYYDFFNNGCCNRAADFRKVFGFGGRKADGYAQDVNGRLNAVMDNLIIDAALELDLI